MRPFYTSIYQPDLEDNTVEGDWRRGQVVAQAAANAHAPSLSGRFHTISLMQVGWSFRR